MTLSDADMAEAISKVGKPHSTFSKPPLDIDVKKAADMRAAGFSLQQIGDYFDCSRVTIMRRLRAAEAGRTVTPAPFHIYAALAARGILPKPPETDPGPDLFDSLINARLRKREEA